MRACENKGPPPLPKQETFFEGRRDTSSPPVFKSAMRCAQARAPGRSPVRARWPAGGRPCPAQGSQTGTARSRMGGEGECARMGDSNPGCNYPVRQGQSGVPVCAGQPTREPGAGFADVFAGWRARARGLMRALAPPWLQPPRASRQSLLPF